MPLTHQVNGDTFDNSYNKNQNQLFDVSSVLVGYFFAFDASGGFAVQEGFKNIIINPISKLVEIDTTNTIQVLMDYKYINSLLGISYELISINDTIRYDICANTDFYIDASGIFINDTDDTIVLSANQFVENISESNILSVGSLSTVYTDYLNYVNNIFNPSKNSEVFTASTLDICSNSLLNASGFISLISNRSNPNWNTNYSGYLTDLSGDITISNISKIIRYSCQYNIFNNRTNGQTVYDAFQPRDLIYVPNGIQVSLNVGIKVNSNSQIDAFINNTVTKDLSYNDISGNQIIFEELYSAAAGQLANITRKVQTPLLIILADLTPAENAPYIISS
jgi:hypothetical protein